VRVNIYWKPYDKIWSLRRKGRVMDKDSFWKEVTDIARHHKQRSHPVEQLPKEQMEQLESTVFEHIDQLFSDSD